MQLRSPVYVSQASEVLTELQSWAIWSIWALSWLIVSRTALGPQCHHPMLPLLLYGSDRSLWRPALEAGQLQCSPGMLAVLAAEGHAPRVQACRCCWNFLFRCPEISNSRILLTCRSLRNGCQRNVRAMPSLLTFSPVWRELCGVSGSAQQDREHEPIASAFSTLALHAVPSTAGAQCSLAQLAAIAVLKGRWAGTAVTFPMGKQQTHAAAT